MPKYATRLGFTSAPCSHHHRGFHPSWSCKRAGLLEISANILSVLLEIKLKSSSSALGTGKLVLIFVMLQFGSMTTSPFAAALRSICLIAAGKHTVTLRIQPSKRLCFTFLSREVAGNFSRAQHRTAMSAGMYRSCNFTGGAYSKCPVGAAGAMSGPA